MTRADAGKCREVLRAGGSAGSLVDRSAVAHPLPVETLPDHRLSG